MEITEVRIKLMEEPGERLKAFCSITFDDAFVVRDLKIIEGSSGPFVAMPSRKLTSHCPYCGCKNHLRAAFCNQCGKRLREAHGGQGRRRSGQALRRHRASDQFLVPRDDPESGDPGVRGGNDAGEHAGLHVALRRFRRRGHRRHARLRSSNRTQIQPAEKPRGPHTAPPRRTQPPIRARGGRSAKASSSKPRRPAAMVLSSRTVGLVRRATTLSRGGSGDGGGSASRRIAEPGAACYNRS